jgi:hypothetical protein
MVYKMKFLWVEFLASCFIISFCYADGGVWIAYRYEA